MAGRPIPTPSLFDQPFPLFHVNPFYLHTESSPQIGVNVENRKAGFFVERGGQPCR
jgi:hypothetical protein